MFKIFLNNKKKKTILVIVALLAVAGLFYSNRAYSYIYSTIAAAGLTPVDNKAQYFIDVANQTNNMDITNIVYSALGDSLTAGAGVDNYQESLSYILADKLSGGEKTVILNNHSLPGIETAGIISDYLEPAISDDPDLITVLVGINDIHNKVSAARFRKNYEEILSRLKQETKADIYLISIPFIGADSLMLQPYQVLFDARTREFDKIIKELADKYSVNYIDLYAPTVDLFKTSGDHYSRDLFHPSASGYRLWADIIYADINK
jgi:lysophospholipase L1-like esterase